MLIISSAPTFENCSINVKIDEAVVKVALEMDSSYKPSDPPFETAEESGFTSPSRTENSETIAEAAEGVSWVAETAEGDDTTMEAEEIDGDSRVTETEAANMTSDTFLCQPISDEAEDITRLDRNLAPFSSEKEVWEITWNKRMNHIFLEKQSCTFLEVEMLGRWDVMYSLCLDFLYSCERDFLESTRVVRVQGNSNGDHYFCIRGIDNAFLDWRTLAQAQPVKLPQLENLATEAHTNTNLTCWVEEYGSTRIESDFENTPADAQEIDNFPLLPTSQIPLTPSTQSPRPRGRPKGSSKKKGKLAHVATTPILAPSPPPLPAADNQLMVLPIEFQQPQGIMTRAKSAMLMGKRLGMIYDCSDEEVMKGIASQIAARH